MGFYKRLSNNVVGFWMTRKKLEGAQIGGGSTSSSEAGDDGE
jgi:hypothetical protein